MKVVTILLFKSLIFVQGASGGGEAVWLTESCVLLCDFFFVSYFFKVIGCWLILTRPLRGNKKNEKKKLLVLKTFLYDLF